MLDRISVLWLQQHVKTAMNISLTVPSVSLPMPAMPVITPYLPMSLMAAAPKNLPFLWLQEILRE
jgi:hypothetical protein